MVHGLHGAASCMPLSTLHTPHPNIKQHQHYTHTSASLAYLKSPNTLNRLRQPQPHHQKFDYAPVPFSLTKFGPMAISANAEILENVWPSVAHAVIGYNAVQLGQVEDCTINVRWDGIYFYLVYKCVDGYI